MNARERFLALMNFEPLDRTLMWEWGYWGSTLKRWYQEGLPICTGAADAMTDGAVVLGEFLGIETPDPQRPFGADIHMYFDLDEPMHRVPLNNYLYPRFTEELLEDHGDWMLWRDRDGITRRDRKDRTTLPHFVGNPVVTRDDWEQIKAERLRPTLEGRLPDNWPSFLAAYRDRTFPLAIGGYQGFYGTSRYLLGEERVLTIFYDDPALMHDIIDYMADFLTAIYDQVLSQVRVDVAFTSEDMCYKGGSLISPAMFRKFMLPAYKKLTGMFRDHGVKHIQVDTDGDCRILIPLFMEGGVTGLFPFEVNAGMNVSEVRKAFPKLEIIGGVDKTKLAGSPADAEAEARRVAAAIPYGGYIPTVDHLCPPDVSFQNFKHYRTLLNDIIQQTPCRGQPAH